MEGEYGSIGLPKKAMKFHQGRDIWQAGIMIY